MSDDTKGGRTTKIHRQMHEPITHGRDSVVVHLDKKEDMTIAPRNQRTLGENRKKSVSARRTISLATVDERLEKRKKVLEEPSPKRLSAREIKEREIQKALNIATKDSSNKEMRRGAKRPDEMAFGFRRFALAAVCVAVAVFAIIYFINLNATDISLKVTALQTGIEAVYPSYVPQDYNLSDITSENGKVVMNFKNSSGGESYTITEEASSWDSNALLNNFIKSEFGEDYIVLKEQGLTIYANDGNAAWVNGGLLFKLKITSGSLTKKQIQTIATSL